MTNKYGDLLVLVRQAKGLSQEQLANKVGINKSLVSRYESGERTLSLEKFISVNERLEIPPSLLKLLTEQSIRIINKKLAQEIGLLLIREVSEGLKNGRKNKSVRN